MRVLSLLLALPSAAGLVGPELLHRLGPARGVVPAPSRRRAHVVVLAAARWAAPTIGESQQQLQAVQRNVSCLARAARPEEDPCDAAEPVPRSANLDSDFGGMQLFAPEAWRAAPLLLTHSAQLTQPTVRLPQL